MSELPTSITARVQAVEADIANVRARLCELQDETDETALLSTLLDLTTKLQSIRSAVDDIRRLVRYN